MTSTVFISDLHLSRDSKLLNRCFKQFIEHIACDYQQVYILGDFFNVWVGDDGLDDWSLSIASMLASLAEKGIKVWLMHGNRDFLVGKKFADIARCELIPDPYVIDLNGEKIVLTHGDDLCTLDKQHQRFRAITRNRLVKRLFLALPLAYRQRLANNIRKKSQLATKTQAMTDIVMTSLEARLTLYKSDFIIHGHTHNPQLHYFKTRNGLKKRIVLTDWRDNNYLLCYNAPNGFYVRHLSGGSTCQIQKKSKHKLSKKR